MSSVGFFTGALFDSWETSSGFESEREFLCLLTIGLLADLNWLEFDLDLMGSGTSGPFLIRRSCRAEDEDVGGLTGTVDGMFECEVTFIMLAGGLRVSLLGLTAGPPEERLDSSLNSDTWEMTGVGTEVER